MTLEQQVCSLELAKRLKELGVKQESLFYWCDRMQTSEHRTVVVDFHLIYGHEGWVEEVRCSAFTVAELGEMLPVAVETATDIYVLEMRKLTNEPLYWLQYENARKAPYTTEESTEADARAKMLIYLFENKLITL